MFCRFCYQEDSRRCDKISGMVTKLVKRFILQKKKIYITINFIVRAELGSRSLIACEREGKNLENFKKAI